MRSKTTSWKISKTKKKPKMAPTMGFPYTMTIPKKLDPEDLHTPTNSGAVLGESRQERAGAPDTRYAMLAVDEREVSVRLRTVRPDALHYGLRAPVRMGADLRARTGRDVCSSPLRQQALCEPGTSLLRNRREQRGRQSSARQSLRSIQSTDFVSSRASV